MKVKKFMEYTIKGKVYLPTDKAPEKSIDEIIEGINALGVKAEITGTKLTDNNA